MSPVWDDVNARVRGLATRLLTRPELEALAREPDLAGLAATLRHRQMLPGIATETPDAESIELGLRRWAGALLHILGRWAGDRAEAMPLVFDDEDRRSLRAILRGSLQHAPAATRLGGLIPTPLLPELALESLANASGIPEAVGMLASWRHPMADDLAEAGAGVTPDALAIDQALARAVARRATALAERCHDRNVRRFVREGIDLDNAVTALVAAAAGHDVAAATLFIDGGTRIPIGVFEAACGAGTRPAASVILARALQDTPYAAALQADGSDPVVIGETLVRQRIGHLAQRIRRNPLTALMPIWFALRLRAQMVDLQRIVWTIALNGPRRWLLDAWMTAA